VCVRVRACLCAELLPHAAVQRHARGRFDTRGGDAGRPVVTSGSDL
jgi:hypothetical protein